MKRDYRIRDVTGISDLEMSPTQMREESPTAG